jgi:hypothetical protein
MQRAHADNFPRSHVLSTKMRAFELPLMIACLLALLLTSTAAAASISKLEIANRRLLETKERKFKQPKQNVTAGNCPIGWLPASGTLYSSWPMPGSQECVIYEGCKWAGMFSSIEAGENKKKCAKGAAYMSGGNGTKKACRFTPSTVKSMRMASTSLRDFTRLKGKTLEVMIEGITNRTTTVTIRDNCNDADCRSDNCGGVYAGCCSKHSDNYKYTLLDLEANPASDLLGIDLTKEDVGGPFQNEKMPLWAQNFRPGLPSCIAGNFTMPLCYRITK